MFEIVGRQLLQAVRRPSRFAALAMTLALAAGTFVTVATFVVVDAVLLRPLGVSEPESLVVVSQDRLDVFGRGTRGLVTTAHLLDWKEQGGEIAQISGFQLWTHSPDAEMDWLTAGTTSRLRGAIVTPEFFQTVGVMPLVGHVPGAHELDGAGPQPVLVSRRFWEQHLGGRINAVGMELQLLARDGPRTVAIAGVVPDTLRFTHPEEVQIWGFRSWATVRRQTPVALNYLVVARIAGGVSMEAAAARFRSPSERSPSSIRTQAAIQRIRVEPITDYFLQNDRRPAFLLAAVAALILVLVSVSLVVFVTLDLDSRTSELSLRAALGAARGALVAHAWSESLMMCILGIAIGDAVLLMGLRRLTQWITPVFSFGNDLSATLGVTAAANATILAAVFIGSAYASRHCFSELSATNTHWYRFATMNQEMARRARRLITVHVAVLTALILLAARLLLSISDGGRDNLGYAREGLAAVEVRLYSSGLQGGRTIAAFREELTEMLKGLPSIGGAAATSSLPLFGADTRRLMQLPDGRRVTVYYRGVDAEFFSLLGIRVLRGRVFSNVYSPGERHAVISRSLADELFGQGDPIGNTVTFEKPFTVVGIVEDLRYVAPHLPTTPAMYVPIAEIQPYSFWIALRPKPVAPISLAQVQLLAQTLGPSQPIRRLVALDEPYDSLSARAAFFSKVVALVSAFAVGLSLCSLGATLLHLFRLKRREIAVRFAVGATISNVARELLKRDAVSIAVGCLAGGVSGAVLIALVDRMLVGMPTLSAAVFILILGVVSGTCLIVAAATLSRSWNSDIFRALSD